MTKKALRAIILWLISMKKLIKILAVTVLLFFMCSLLNFEITNAFPPPPTNHITIINPPDPLSPIAHRYENSTVQLEISVVLLGDSPKLTDFSYSLDGKPSIKLRNFTSTHSQRITPNQAGYPEEVEFTVFTAEVELADLSEGNHSVTAYANGMSTYREFTVNSNYQIAVIEVLSPINQTYSKRPPLIFTTNGDVKSAHYYMYKYRGFFDNGYVDVFEKHFSGNTTIDNLSMGSYVLYLYVTTEKGEATEAAYFSTSKYIYSDNNNSLVYIFIVIVAVAIAGSVFLFFLKKHKSKTIKSRNLDRTLSRNVNKNTFNHNQLKKVICAKWLKP